MKFPRVLLSVAVLASAVISPSVFADHHENHDKPINALLVTGGCCHNYKTQTQSLQDGLKPYGDIHWFMKGVTERRPRLIFIKILIGPRNLT